MNSISVVSMHIKDIMYDSIMQTYCATNYASIQTRTPVII